MDYSDDEEEISSDPPPAPQSSPVPTPSVEKTPVNILLEELENSLEGTLSYNSRAAVIKYLRGRLEGISDETKRQTAMGKIAARLGDEAYWVQFASNLGG